MPQSLIQLPETADFKIIRYHVKMKNHVFPGDGLMGRIIAIIGSEISNRDTLYQFEKHGISFEAAIECCAAELEQRAWILENIIFWIYCIQKRPTNKYVTRVLPDYVKSVEGRKIAAQLIEKIRSCSDWGELYDELKITSKFNINIKQNITDGMTHQCRKV